MSVLPEGFEVTQISLHDVKGVCVSSVREFKDVSTPFTVKTISVIHEDAKSGKNKIFSIKLFSDADRKDALKMSRGNDPFSALVDINIAEKKAETD